MTSLVAVVSVIAAPDALAVVAVRLRATIAPLWVIAAPARRVASPRTVPPTPMSAAIPLKASVPVVVMLTAPPLPLA